MKRLFVAFFLLALTCPAVLAADKQDCTLRMISSIDMDMDDNGLVRVPVTLNGQPFRMLVDTGDYLSVITTRTAKALGKKPTYADNFALEGWGGRPINQFVTLESVGFGRLKRGYTQFMVMNDDEEEFDGLFGADFLYYLDLDFDFAKGKLNLISPEHCKGKTVYWTTGSYAEIPFDWKQRAIKLTIKLDGKDVKALIDTGASDTVMSLETAAELFKLDEQELIKARGKHAFKELSLGGVTVYNPAIHLVRDKDSRLIGGHNSEDMILGMTVLRRLHFYVGYQEEMLYVTPATQY